MAPHEPTINTAPLLGLPATEPVFDAESRELRAAVQLGPRNTHYLVHLELAARHDRERQVFEGLLRWRLTNLQGEGSFHSSSHARDVVIIEVQNPRYSAVRLQEVFGLAAAELQKLAIARPQLFTDLLNPAHDEWARQQGQAKAA
jgi:hypothetical protein